MIQIHFSGNSFYCVRGDNLLDVLLKNGCKIPWVCRSGICHSCIMKLTEGNVPNAANVVLNKEQKSQNLFLACQCYPEENVSVQIPQELHHKATIIKTRLINPLLMEVHFVLQKPLKYRPGQHIEIGLGEQSKRRYCLISQPEESCSLIIHLQRRVGGCLSTILFDEPFKSIPVRLGALDGECHYNPTLHRTKPLIIFGEDAAIGVANAVLNDAKYHKHSSSIICLFYMKNQVNTDMLAIKEYNDVHVFKETLPTQEQITSLLEDIDVSKAQCFLFGSVTTVCKIIEFFEINDIDSHQIEKELFGPAPSNGADI